MDILGFTSDQFDKDMGQYTGSDTSSDGSHECTEHDHHKWTKGFSEIAKVDIFKT